jgi:hypothetical protein
MFVERICPKMLLLVLGFSIETYVRYYVLLVTPGLLVPYGSSSVLDEYRYEYEVAFLVAFDFSVPQWSLAPKIHMYGSSIVSNRLIPENHVK